MKEIKIEQQSPEWYGFRKNHIGSSDCSVVLNKNPWKFPEELWQEYVGLKTNNFDNKNMQEGRRLEPIARAWYSQHKGEIFEPIVAQHETIEYLSASLDGISLDRKKALEIKCGARAFAMAQEGVIPEYYMCQCQHIYLVTGCASLDYLAFDPKEKKEPIVIPVECDLEFQLLAIPEYAQFWDCVVNFISPTALRKGYRIGNE